VLCESVVDWVQMFLGYCLTGEPLQELFAILNGCGGNGKTLLKNALQKAFGSYCTTGDRAFAWSGDSKKLSSNDSFGKNVAKYSKLGQNERFLLHWVGLGTL
jgi:putative DNA primase/helicase